MVDCNSIVPVPAVKLRLVEAQLPLIISVPPFVILSALAAVPALTLETLSRFVPPATQLRVLPVLVPITNVP